MCLRLKRILFINYAMCQVTTFYLNLFKKKKKSVFSFFQLTKTVGKKNVHIAGSAGLT